MRKLSIGLDIDGCITRSYYYLPFFNKLYNKNIKESQCTQYFLRGIFGIDESEWKLKYNQNIKGFFDSVDIRENAVETLSRIKLIHNCNFITARENTKYVRQRTEDYLKDNKLHDIPLHMLSSHYKVDKAKELSIDVFVEDSESNALELADSGIKVLLMDANYNKNVRHENIIRVNNWLEIEEILKRI